MNICSFNFVSLLYNTLKFVLNYQDRGQLMKQIK